MVNLLTSSQMREADAFTIVNKPIASIDLMEAAAAAFVKCFIRNFPDRSLAITVYCGTGNNGGDGLAIARLLQAASYKVAVKVAFFNSKTSADFDVNLARLASGGIAYSKIDPDDSGMDEAEIIIDALLGSGLNKPLQNSWANLVTHLNTQTAKVVSVDIPTGMPAEGPIATNPVAIKSDLTITFERPKLNFFFPESQDYVRRFEVVDIGLDEEYLQSKNSGFQIIEETDIKRILRSRRTFSHKGTYGHALILAGSKETMGAALLCAEASVYSGSGLTTSCIPAEGLTALNIRLPEAMAILRTDSSALPELQKFTAIAAGPGLGTTPNAAELVSSLIKVPGKPFVLDADALNIIAKDRSLLGMLPGGIILTPHLKEFDRIFGEHANWWQRLETAKAKAIQLRIIIVLKNRYTFIILPGNKVLINPTGAPNMATGGMGDVLTGMVASFLAQGYTPHEAASLAVYIHGLCGQGYEGYVCPPSELCKLIPGVMKSLVELN